MLQEVTDPQWEEQQLSRAREDGQDEYLVMTKGKEGTRLCDNFNTEEGDGVARRAQLYHYLTGNLETPLGNATWVRAPRGVMSMLIRTYLPQNYMPDGEFHDYLERRRSVRLDGDETDTVLETAVGLLDPRSTGHLSTLKGALQAARLLHES